MNDAPVPRAPKTGTIKNFGNFSLDGVETLTITIFKKFLWRVETITLVHNLHICLLLCIRGLNFDTTKPTDS